MKQLLKTTTCSTIIDITICARSSRHELTNNQIEECKSNTTIVDNHKINVCTADTYIKQNTDKKGYISMGRPWQYMPIKCKKYLNTIPIHNKFNILGLKSNKLCNKLDLCIVPHSTNKGIAHSKYDTNTFNIKHLIEPTYLKHQGAPPHSNVYIHHQQMDSLSCQHITLTIAFTIYII